MLALHHQTHLTAKPETRKAQWLPVLEQELKRRIGWVDEAISPFARRLRVRRAANTHSTDFHVAA
jgi:hypothetical protein